VHLDISLAQLDITEVIVRENIRYFYQFKLSFHEHGERMLSVCNQRLYLVSQSRKQGLSDKCTGIVYDAIVIH